MDMLLQKTPSTMHVSFTITHTIFIVVDVKKHLCQFLVQLSVPTVYGEEPITFTTCNYYQSF